MATSDRTAYYLRKYGITETEYQAILKDSNGVCWICRRPPKTRRLSVDHEHQRGEWKLRKLKHMAEIRTKVRGVLCSLCNRGLPKFRDNPELFERAALYLRTRPAQKVLTKR